MRKKAFKTESKRILDLMINSIYTHREIFLRELISNGSDAIDKLCYRALTDDSVTIERSEYRIRIQTDQDARTLTVSDNGLGMTEEEMEQNLGVIARSGSLQFKNELESADTDDVDIIGQFGVGFYAAFMVADHVTVVSRKYGEETGARWESDGADGYTVEPCEKAEAGTDVILTLKPDTDGENYSEFLEDWRLRSLVKKYSDYIRWPIVLGEETVNSMVPIWHRSRAECSDADCAAFYKEKYFDARDPLSVIRVNAEGAVSYRAMLFIPAAPPSGYYTTTYEPGLQLYASGVLIMDRCEQLLPECFRFVRGVVDSQDLSLNISRELLQHDRQLKLIAANLEKKVKSELKRLLTAEPEKYREFFKGFGLQLKYGVVADYGMKKDLLADLLLFYSEKAETAIPLESYVKAMPESQKYIYYACGESAAVAAGLPQAEPVRDAGFDILYMTDSVDEFVVRMLGAYLEKEFRSVNNDDPELESDDEKSALDKAQSENQALLDFVRETLTGKITDARLSHKLKSHPVCLTAEGPVSLDMERYFSAVPTEEGQAVKAQRVLELNPGHPVFAALSAAFAEDREKAAEYVWLLHDQALLLAGFMPEDPAAMTRRICDLMA